MLVFNGLNAVAQATKSLTPADFRARAEKIYQEEQQRWRTDTTNPTNIWHFARASFDWAEFATNDDQREEIATAAIAACRQLTLSAPTLAAGHYYLAMNLGQLARTKTLGALKLVREMEQEFELASGLDPRFDFAGPDRSLGILYFEAPGWPTSIGNRTKARTHLARAVELAPDYPDNHLSLLEALLKWSDKKSLRSAIEKFEALLPAARRKLTGELWEASWVDWDKRWETIKKKADKLK